MLTRIFQKTSVYVIPSSSSSSPYVLFLFEILEKTNTDEYKKILSSTNSILLQFVHIHQLLSKKFYISKSKKKLNKIFS